MPLSAPVGRERMMTQSIDFSPRSVPLIRSQLQRWMDAHQAPRRMVEDARIVVSELVTNALQHGSPLPNQTLLVGWKVLDENVEIFVRDGGGAGYPRALHAGQLAGSGRGLAIVSALADRWWVTTHRDGMTVQAVIALQ